MPINYSEKSGNRDDLQYHMEDFDGERGLFKIIA